MTPRADLSPQTHPPFSTLTTAILNENLQRTLTPICNTPRSNNCPWITRSPGPGRTTKGTVARISLHLPIAVTTRAFLWNGQITAAAVSWRWILANNGCGEQSSAINNVSSKRCHPLLSHHCAFKDRHAVFVFSCSTLAFRHPQKTKSHAPECVLRYPGPIILIPRTYRARLLRLKNRSRCTTGALCGTRGGTIFADFRQRCCRRTSRVPTSRVPKVSAHSAFPATLLAMHARAP